MGSVTNVIFFTVHIGQLEAKWTNNDMIKTSISLVYEASTCLETTWKS